jgi:hypothetical protein
MIAQLSKRIELKFWDIVIPVLSDSTWLRNTVQKAVKVFNNKKLVKQIASLVVIACAGFASGFLIFSLAVIFA